MFLKKRFSINKCPALALLAICCLLLDNCSVLTVLRGRRSVSPYDFGLSQAHSGIERYYVLYNTHKAAVEAGVNVDYSGIKRIDLEIPADAVSIPLTSENDFKGVVFNVTNTTKHHVLFSLAQKDYKISVNKADIDRGVFKKYPELARGKKLLIVADDTPWVENREGFSYGHIRKDLLLLNNGKALNKTVMPYNNPQSSPSCTWCVAKPVSVMNVTFNRTTGSSFRTFLCSIQGFNEVTLSGILVFTPDGEKMNADRVIRLYDCSNVKINNVRIEGTYSQVEHFGYGFDLNNIWNLTACKLYGKANWGIFGTNNVNTAFFDDCDINRFDIHCYGRDIFFNNVHFTDRYNQLASVYGTVSFERCTYTDFCPVVNGPSHNVYVGYDLVMADCVFNVTPKNRKLMDCGRLDGKRNEREELSDRCLPNVTIKNLTVNVPDNVQDVTLMYFRTVPESQYAGDIKYMENLTIDGLTFHYDTPDRAPVNFFLSNIDLPLQNRTVVSVRNLDLMGNAVNTKNNKGRLISNLKKQSKAIILDASGIRATAVQ
jgi:hypothetical protein